MSFYVWCNKICSSTFGNYLLFFTSPLHLWSSVRLDGADAHFQVSQVIIDWFKSRQCLGHSRTFTALCISHSCCVLRVTVLLEGKPSVQSEVLNALDLVFFKVFISIFWWIEIFLYPDESLSPCCWKTAPQHEAATSTLYFWDGTLQVMSRAVSLQTWCLELRFIRPEKLVSQSLRVL